jgi:hypothetical protein
MYSEDDFWEQGRYREKYPAEDEGSTEYLSATSKESEAYSK